MEGIHNNQGVNSNNKQLMERTREKDKQILANIEEQKGNAPTPLKIMAMRPGTLTAFMAYRNQIFENGPLTEREQSLVAIGTAVAMRSSKCVWTHSNNAREAGISEDEIVQAMLIASVMLGASPLRSAYSGVYKKE